MRIIKLCSKTLRPVSGFQPVTLGLYEEEEGKRACVVPTDLRVEIMEQIVTPGHAQIAVTMTPGHAHPSE